MIPKTLAQVAALSACGQSSDLCLGNFLDGFFAKPTPEALAPEPVRLAANTPEMPAARTIRKRTRDGAEKATRQRPRTADKN